MYPSIHSSTQSKAVLGNYKEYTLDKNISLEINHKHPPNIDNHRTVVASKYKEINEITEMPKKHIITNNEQTFANQSKREYVHESIQVNNINTRIDKKLIHTPRKAGNKYGLTSSKSIRKTASTLDNHNQESESKFDYRSRPKYIPPVNASHKAKSSKRLSLPSYDAKNREVDAIVKKDTFFYKVNEFSKKEPPPSERHKAQKKAAGKDKENRKDVIINQQNNGEHQQIDDRPSIDITVGLAARELHAACLFDAPVENVKALLYRHPEVIDNRTVDPFGRSPLEILTEKAMCCTCGSCNYNRNRVIAAVIKGEEFYKIKSTDDNDAASNASTKAGSIRTMSSYSARLKQSKRNVPDPKSNVVSLTKEILNQREVEEMKLYSYRESIWSKHVQKFRKLLRSMSDMVRERTEITAQLNEKIAQIEQLSLKLANQVDNLNFFDKLSSSRYNDKLATGYFKVGMAKLDKSKLEASLLEVEVNIEKVQRDLKYLNSVSFDTLDRQLSQMLGQRSLRNCAIRQELDEFVSDVFIQEFEELKRRFY